MGYNHILSSELMQLFHGTCPNFALLLGGSFQLGIVKLCIFYLKVCLHSENTSKVYYPLKERNLISIPLIDIQFVSALLLLKRTLRWTFTYTHTHLLSHKCPHFCFPVVQLLYHRLCVCLALANIVSFVKTDVPIVCPPNLYEISLL